MDREGSKPSLNLCRDPRLIVYIAYANELTSLQCHVTSCETSGILIPTLFLTQATAHGWICPDFLFPILYLSYYFFGEILTKLDWYNVVLHPEGIFSVLYPLISLKRLIRLENVNLSHFYLKLVPIYSPRKTDRLKHSLGM